MKVIIENVISKDLIPSPSRENQISEMKADFKGKVIAIPNLDNLRSIISSKEKMCIGNTGVEFKLSSFSIVYDETSLELLLVLESTKTKIVCRFPDPEEV